MESSLERLIANPNTLWVVIISGGILFVLMARELSVWFLHISRMENQLHSMGASLERIEEKLDTLEPSATAGENVRVEEAAKVAMSPPETDTPSLAAKPPPSNFPLQH